MNKLPDHMIGRKTIHEPPRIKSLIEKQILNGAYGIGLNNRGTLLFSTLGMHCKHSMYYQENVCVSQLQIFIINSVFFFLFKVVIA